MSEPAICPCDEFVHPRPAFNRPAQETLQYRVGDFPAFRHALLLSRPDETQLTFWRPGGSGDLAVQMVEWWAYLADILTFYNERILNQCALQTADQPESVSRLIRLLGYRPRPGIGAVGIVAALIDGKAPITLPQGFALQSKPGPGKPPQLFELDAKTVLTPPDALAAFPTPEEALFGSDGSVRLNGSVTTLKQGDPLLLVSRTWNGVPGGYASATVQATRLEKDPYGHTMTRVTFTDAGLSSRLPNAAAKDYRLLKSQQFTPIWEFEASLGTIVFERHLSSGKSHAVRLDDIVTSRLEESGAHFVSLLRSLRAGDFLLLDQAGSAARQDLVQVQTVQELVGYKAEGGELVAKPADTTKTPPFPVFHTKIEFAPAVHRYDPAATVAHHDWRDVGDLLGTPASRVQGEPLELNSSWPALFPPGVAQPVIVEDADGNGVLAQGFVGADAAAQIQLSHLSDPAQTLNAPLRLLFALFPVSRGQSVPSEILGSGDASLETQEFVLQKAPLTYLPGQSVSGAEYRSTLRVWIDGIEWQEQASFFGQPPGAKIFVTREDEQGKTHIQFDTRLPSGVNNVVASYRFGSGADTPAPGSLTVITQPQPHLKAIRAPVPLQPGSDPELPQKIRRYAPQSVLTFGRAVSADDYEAIAAQTPGVTRARSYWDWDDRSQRATVTLYIAGGPGAKAAATQAIAAASDPNRSVKIKSATAIPIHLAFTLLVSPDYQTNAVQSNVQNALLNDDTGLFGSRRLQIGEIIFNSEISAACLRVPGAVAIHSLAFSAPSGTETGPRHDPGLGNYYALSAADFEVSTEAAHA